MKIDTNAEDEYMRDKADDYNFYGSCQGSSGTKLFKITFDVLPMNNQVFLVPHSHIDVLGNDKDEPTYDHRQEETEEIMNECAKGAKCSNSEEEQTPSNPS